MVWVIFARQVWNQGGGNGKGLFPKIWPKGRPKDWPKAWEGRSGVEGEWRDILRVNFQDIIFIHLDASCGLL